MSSDDSRSSAGTTGRTRPPLADRSPPTAYHLAVFRSADRARTRAALEAAGVGSAVHYPLAITQQPAYRDLHHASCPEAEAWAAECLSVPCFPEMTETEVDRVCMALAGLNA